VLTETPAPLPPERREGVVRAFRTRIERLTGSESDHGHGHGHGHGHVVSDQDWLTPEDLDTWRQLLDPEGPYYLGQRSDLAVLSVRSVHLGHAPR
jgi:hypothetical protein